MEQITCDVIKCAYRQTKEGYVLSLVLHPQDAPLSLAIAPIGSQWQVTFVPLDENGNAVDDAPSSASREAGAKSDLVGSTLAPVSRLPSPYAREAGMLCNDTDFQDFLEVEYPHEWSILNTGTRAEKAAVIVRKECGVKSRADIRTGPSADAWRLLYENYLSTLDDQQQEQQRREYEEGLARWDDNGGKAS